MLIGGGRETRLIPGGFGHDHAITAQPYLLRTGQGRSILLEAESEKSGADSASSLYRGSARIFGVFHSWSCEMRDQLLLEKSLDIFVS